MPHMEGHSPESFHDHELQTVEFSQTFTPNADGAAFGRGIRYSVDPVGGLDRNEIAELKYYKFYCNLSYRVNDDENAESATILCDYFIGINQDDANFGNNSVDVDLFRPDDNVTNTKETTKNSVNEGMLEHANKVHYPTITDTGGTLGGPGSGADPIVFEQNFDEIYGSGPMLDRFDEFNFLLTPGGENLVAGQIKVEVRGFMVFATDEEEPTGRSSF